MIDVHILHTNEPIEWVEKAEDKLLQNKNTTPHIVDGVNGSVFHGRVNGYKHGNSEVVSFVDPDDDFSNKIFDECLFYLNQGYNAVYTNSLMVYNGRKYKLYKHRKWSWRWHVQSSLPVHQVMVVKREIMERVLHDFESWGDCDLIECAKFFETTLFATQIAKYTPWMFLPDVLDYTWRRANDSANSKSTEKEKECVRSFSQEVKPLWL